MGIWVVSISSPPFDLLSLHYLTDFKVILGLDSRSQIFLDICASLILANSRKTWQLSRISILNVGKTLLGMAETLIFSLITGLYLLIH